MLDKALMLIYAGKSDDDIGVWYNGLSPDERAILDSEIVAVSETIGEAWLNIQLLCSQAIKTIIDYFARNGLLECQHLENE